MNREQLERQFDEAFEPQAVLSPDVPQADYRDSWNRLQPWLAKENRRRKRRGRIGMGVAIAGSLLLGGVIFNNVQVAKAVEPFYATILELPSGIGGLIFGNPAQRDTTKAKTAPPPDYVGQTHSQKPAPTGELQQKIVGVEELPVLLAFPVPVFNFLPEGYALDRVTVYYYGISKAEMVSYAYLNEEGRALSIILTQLKKDTAFGLNVPTEGITVKTINIAGNPAILSYTDKNHASLETIVNDLSIAISGVMPPEDIVRILEKMSYAS